MNSDNAGYTLLEVLIAFAIMAMVLSALIPGQARLQIRSNAADEVFLATDYALSRLDKLGVSEQITSGVQKDLYRDWQVTHIVSEEPFANTDSKVFRIILEIKTRSGRQLAKIETLRIQ